MAQARTHGAHDAEATNNPFRDGAPNDEDRGLLSDDPLADTRPSAPSRHGSDLGDGLVGDDYDGPAAHEGKSPRVPHRVHFDLTPSMIDAPSRESSNGAPRGSSSFDMDAEDPHRGSYLGSHDDHHRQPLLTDMEAPSVALANSPWGDEDVHDWAEQERSRPKSGLRMAFMNMANSIIGAGIIGQPLAFKQAGLLAGIILLVGLTFLVDWTICLIVINSKLSGSNSFQGTVEHCFGKPGLIAISVAQWAFAFGGMVAFGVIVGDSLPHVFVAIWPGLKDIPVLSLLANRQFVIALFVMGISFPLTLYRDIAKVRLPLNLHLFLRDLD